MAVITVSAIIPIISSIIAAPKIAFPERVLSLPSSFKVSTVILTDVAVKITPIKIFCKKTVPLASDSILPGILKKAPTKYPPTKGTATPKIAITKEAFPLFLSSLTSVSRPAQNINTITPISEELRIKSVSVIIPKHAGPKISPASRAPTTCGILNRFVKRPRSFVLINISARSSKNL